MSEDEYVSIRVIETTHVRGAGVYGKNITAAGTSKIVFRKEPFEHFAILPGGYQVPKENVASAIPKGSGRATVQKRTK